MTSKSTARVNGEARNHTPVQANKSGNGHGYARDSQRLEHKGRNRSSTHDRQEGPSDGEKYFVGSIVGVENDMTGREFWKRRDRLQLLDGFAPSILHALQDALDNSRRVLANVIR